jgi:signal transduction histidine kinase
MGWASFGIISIYVVCILAQSKLVFSRPDLLINNLSFLMATGVIIVINAFYRDRAKREAFEQLVSIESARDFLKGELEGGQGSLGALVTEIADQRKELQLARDQAQRALELREEFISIASHELRTPVTAMMMQVQFARRKLNSDSGQVTPTYRKVMEVYDSQLNHLSALIAGLFDCSAARAGQLEVSAETMDLGSAVREVLEQFSWSLRGIEVNLDLEGPVVGTWDRVRISQVLNNLVSNAIKYGEGRPIDITLRRAHGKAILVVRDRGIGIPSEKQHAIFERFERVATERQISGLGLGLYIVKKIVEAHQGEIQVESELGAGTRFTILLPIG